MKGCRFRTVIWTAASLFVLKSFVQIVQVHNNNNNQGVIFADDVLFQPTTRRVNSRRRRTKPSSPPPQRTVQTRETQEDVVVLVRGTSTTGTMIGQKEKETTQSRATLFTNSTTTNNNNGSAFITAAAAKQAAVALAGAQARAAKKKQRTNNSTLVRQQQQQQHHPKPQHEDGTTTTPTTPPPTTTTAPPTATPRFSYAFLIGGVHQDNPGYRGFLYNVMIATRILRDHNSTADVNLMIQFAHQSQWSTIPEDTVVRSMSINIIYLKRPTTPRSFADIQLQKFKILQWTQYDRVLFLDADIMPNKSLDYLFQLSMAGILKENVVVATRGEPANGGFWMVKPHDGDVAQMEAILQKYAEPFDRVIGWGHSFARAKDKWESTTPRWMPRWRFWAAHLDQGLLYYWVKYHQKCVTLIIGERVQNWDQLANGTLVMESEQVRLLDAYTQPEPEYTRQEIATGMAFLREAPYRDYVHFVGPLKPWLGDLPYRWYETGTAHKSHKQLWFHTFSLLNDELQLGLNFSNWEVEKRKLEQPPLGLSDGGNINEGRFTTLKISDDDR